MGEIIQLLDIISARRRSAESAARRDCLERALDVMRGNVISVLTMLKQAPAPERLELLERAEKLIALLQYGTRMLDEEPNFAASGPAVRPPC
jgi:hypothetical protein